MMFLSCVNAENPNSSQISSEILNQSSNGTYESNSTDYRDKELLVRINTSSLNKANYAEITNKIHQKIGSTVLKEFREIKGLQLVRIPENISLTDAIEIYLQNENVIYAESNYLYKQQTIPNDTGYSYQWGLQRINAPLGWDISTGSANVIIAIVDSGIDTNHPDIKYNLWINKGEIPENKIDDDNNGYIDDVYGWNFENKNNNVTDDNGHGTHVAGIIAASGNNTLGVSGVMWNATLMPLKFLDDKGEGYISDAVSAISYATKMGAFIINCSWGGPTYSKALKDIIEASSALVVCAAGNELNSENIEINPNYPASYDSNNLICVAAVDKEDKLCYFSNYGINSVDVAAPGSSILSTLPGSKYGYMQGTSMATPYVSGLAGLIKSMRPELNALQVKYTILNGVDHVDSLAGKILTGGIINVYNSLMDIITDTNTLRVTASLKGGSYYHYPLEINLTLNKPGQIYYTLNGTNPTPSSTLYTGPIMLDNSMFIKFMAVDTIGTYSQVFTENYSLYKLVSYSYQEMVLYKLNNKKYRIKYRAPYTVKKKLRYKVGKKWQYKTVYIIKYKWKYKWDYHYGYRSETRYGTRWELI